MAVIAAITSAVVTAVSSLQQLGSSVRQANFAEKSLVENIKTEERAAGREVEQNSAAAAAAAARLNAGLASSGVSIIESGTSADLLADLDRQRADNQSLIAEESAGRITNLQIERQKNERAKRAAIASGVIGVAGAAASGFALHSQLGQSAPQGEGGSIFTNKTSGLRNTHIRANNIATSGAVNPSASFLGAGALA